MVKPLMIQNDFTIIAFTDHPDYLKIREVLFKFIEVVQSPDTVHIYKVTALSIWNALENGLSKESILELLREHSLGMGIEFVSMVEDVCFRYGVLSITSGTENQFCLESKISLLHEIRGNKVLKKILVGTDKVFYFDKIYRNEVKSQFIKLGYPVKDKLAYCEGSPLSFSWNDSIKLKGYQKEAASAMSDSGGNGVVILPCGGGKTFVGIEFIRRSGRTALIITNSEASVLQWRKTLLECTSLREHEVSVYTSGSKVIAPITIVTYNMTSYKSKGVFKHFEILGKAGFGVTVADEVHLLPADMFRMGTAFQTSKKLGLTATFVREDGRETEIFSLIGPKRYEKPWKDLEASGGIAKLTLKDVKSKFSGDTKIAYDTAPNGQVKFEIAATAEGKTEVLRELMERHKDDKILVIGHFTKHLIKLGEMLGVPVVYGDTPGSEREHYYNLMRNGSLGVLIASKVANAALDIPSINVVIQISFQYGSRNEEAQRAGRATRPKEKQSYFYTIVSKGTLEEDYNYNRQKFLINEGYKYEVLDLAG